MTTMTHHNALGLATVPVAGGFGAVSIFDHRVTSRLSTSTVYVERPRRDVMAERLAESLHQFSRPLQLAVPIAPVQAL